LICSILIPKTTVGVESTPVFFDAKIYNTSPPDKIACSGLITYRLTLNLSKLDLSQ